MLADVFDSGTLPSEHRVEAWRELMTHALAPNEVLVEDPASFRASLRARDLGDVQVTALTYSALRSHRTPKLIRRSDPGHYVAALTLSGHQWIAQERRHASITAGELVLYCDSRPYDSRAEPVNGRRTAATVLARFDPGTLPLPADHLNRLLATRLPGEEGVGGLLAAFLGQLATASGTFGPADSARLGSVLVDLITAWLAHSLDLRSRTAVETRQRVQLLEIRAFIVRHLADPELTPLGVAAAHHVSLRTLHRLFQDGGVTVAAYIRGQRLLRARRDLADPRLAARPVHAIGRRWGFAGPSEFSRAFRSSYGVSPSEYRAVQLHVPR
ncbi:helix-turn-helix domain-containing protein [Streptomyces sp. NPDC007920]|uniref:AraC-like ligand-binding domain-containing protein n=1 Tax=Streptomyces sp. NPDC007920 TaxID=3364794 RepID=UPI0036F08FB0